MENGVAGDGANTYSYDASNLRIFDGTKYHFWSPDGKMIGSYTFGPVFVQYGWELRFYRQQDRAYFGRFLTPDPHPPAGRLQDPAAWNRYTYANGDPVNGNDPNGL